MGPAGRVDATNYLVDSVNWSHSDWANLSTVTFVSDICCVSHQPQRPVWYYWRKNVTAERTAHCISLFILGLSVFYRNVLYCMHRCFSDKLTEHIAAHSVAIPWLTN